MTGHRRRCRPCARRCSPRTSPSWNSSAHSLKGAALNVGADGLGAICQQVESSGRGATLTGVDQALLAAEVELGLLDPVVVSLVAELEG